MPSRHRRPTRAGRGIALLAASLLGPVATAGAATVESTVLGAIPNAGPVLASLCAGGLDRSTCALGQRREAESSTVSFTFPDVEPGRYASRAFQDTAGDGVRRRSRMGRPLEPYGLSNGAGRSHSPSFEQAAVRVGEGGARIAVRLDRPGPR